MRTNLANQLERLKSENAILAALKNPIPTRYTEIEERAGLSSRTLSKHLAVLVTRGLIDKRGGRYRITSVGLEYLNPLSKKLERLVQYRMTLLPTDKTRPLRHSAVEVTGGISSETCIGIFDVLASQKVGFSERYVMDRALTNAIHIIADSVPKDSKEFTLTIAGYRTESKREK